MNETDADISVSGKSSKMPNQVSECTKLHIPLRPDAAPNLSKAVFSGISADFSPSATDYFRWITGFANTFSYFSLIGYGYIPQIIQITGCPFCVISIRPICTPPEKIWCNGSALLILKSFIRLSSFVCVSVLYWFVSVSVLAAADIKWYDMINSAVYPHRIRYNWSLRERKVSYFADRWIH